MNRQKQVLLVVVLVVFGAAGFYLRHLHRHQKLGVPGIRATSIPGSMLMDVRLPQRVLNFSSVEVPPSEQETNMLPKDTTIIKRFYQDSTETNFSGFSVNVIMMGTDRTSIHKPDYCLTGQGWDIVEKREIKIPMDGSPGYELPIARWSLKKIYNDGKGHSEEYRGYYVFWYTADNELSDAHPFWRIVGKVLTTGVLPRWSYISYFVFFYPGQDEYAAEKLIQFVAASAPEFQLPPRGDKAALTAR